MENLSPAFLNRFTVINLEDQLENASEKEEKDAIYNIICSENINLSKKEKIINNIYEIYKEKKLTISDLSKLIKGVVRLLNLIKTEENINLYKKEENINLNKTEENIEEIINYVSKIVLSNEIKIDIPIIVDNITRKIFEKNERLSIEERFYFQNSSNLRNLMINLYVCSECRIPVCLVGATGLGKTSMARAFSEIIRKEYPILYSFHMETQLTDLYGVFTFEAGRAVIKDGPLVKAMENGNVFIADEFNLAEDTILQSINVALEPSDDNSIFFISYKKKKIKRKN